MSNNISLDFGRLPLELKLLLEIIKSENNEDFQTKLLEQNKDIDWELFLNLAEHHRLIPLLFSKVKCTRVEIFPQFVLQAIYKEYRDNTFKMLNLTAVMEEVSKIFLENEIPLLVLKGPVLAVDLYGNLSLRTCRDLDLLVPIYDLEKVNMLLLRLGYKKDESLKIETQFKDWKWRYHHISYFHPIKKVKLEIHWRLNPGPGKEPKFQDLWERKRISPLTNHPVFYLGREDLFYFLITHGARHGWSRLRWLIDIKEILSQEINWKKGIRILRENQSIHLGGQAILLTSKLLNTPLTKENLLLTQGNHARKLAQSTLFYLERMVNLHSEQCSESDSKFHQRYLLSLKTKQQKLFYWISVFYPSITDVKTLRLPKYLYILYFLLRPVFLVLRKKGLIQ